MNGSARATATDDDAIPPNVRNLQLSMTLDKNYKYTFFASRIYCQHKPRQIAWFSLISWAIAPIRISTESMRVVLCKFVLRIKKFETV